MRTFQIRSGVTIGLMGPVDGPRRYRTGPAFVTDEELGPKLSGYLESGYLLEPGRPARTEEIPIMGNDSVRVKGDPLPRTKPEDLGRKPSKMGDRIRSKAKFDVDPRTLAGKTLDDLNLLIGEIDPSEGPVRTIEAALHVLTQDFRRSGLPEDLGITERDDAVAVEAL